MNNTIKEKYNIGLTDLEVEEKRKQGKINKIYTKTSKSYAKIFFENFFTWFNLICFLIAGVLVSVESYENLPFILIFLANLLIGLFQEIKAKRMVDKISVYVTNKAKVLRNGEEKDIDFCKVVEGDIIYFETGDQICCDCILLEGKLETNESMITGESKSVKKKEGEQLLGGSFVVSGKCKAIAVKVGMESYSSTLIKKAREFKKNKSDILKTLNFIIKTIGVLIVPLGILTFFDLKNSTGNIRLSLINTSGSIIGMMPVGMFLLTSVSLVVGVIKLARYKTLVQDSYAIEMLARTNVLCLDKTGTLTDGTMKVVNFLTLNKDIKETKSLIKKYISNLETVNQTQKALRDFFGKEKQSKIKNKIEFSSERKFSAITFDDLKTYIMGAPEFVSKNINQETKETINNFTSNGFRVVLFCQNKKSIKDDEIDNNSIPLAIIVLQDNIREDAKQTINWFNQNDVEIKIISGDNVDTVSVISQKVGVIGAEKAISLFGKSDEEVKKLALEYNVFGRVTPEQKCLIVKALKEKNKKVAMTGDGVNDILALKESDCSIAMACGSEATRSASNFVMLENKFSSMPKIVAEGRRVINNISKASSLFLTKTFFTMFLTIFVLINPTLEYPLQSNQIFLWETLFIGIPAFLLALQPNNEKIEGSFIGSLTSKALPGALTLFLSAMACYIYLSTINDLSLIATLISYTVTFGAFFILLNLCLPLDKFRTTIVLSLLIICALSFFIIPKSFFNYQILSGKEIIFLICAWIFIYCVYALMRRLFERIFKSKKV